MNKYDDNFKNTITDTEKMYDEFEKKHKGNIEIDYVKHALMDMHYVFNDIYCSDDECISEFEYKG